MFLEKLWLIELIMAAVFGVLALLWHWRRGNTGQPGKTKLLMLLFAFFIVAAIASFVGGIIDRRFGTSPVWTFIGTVVAVYVEIKIALRSLIRGDDIDVDELTR